MERKEWSEMSKSEQKRRLALAGQLYGTVDNNLPENQKNQEKVDMVKKETKSAAPAVPTEHQEQVKLVTWLAKENILHFAIPNGGSRHKLEAVKFKREGVKAGVPDIFIPYARKCWSGLFIEMKRQRGGRLSEAQRFWFEKLSRNGYCVRMCVGGDDAIEQVQKYFREAM